RPESFGGRRIRNVRVFEGMAQPAPADFCVGRGDGEHLQLKDQSCIRAYSPSWFALVAESEVGRHKNLPFGPDFHARESVLPALTASAAANEIMAVPDKLLVVNKSAPKFDVNDVVSGRNYAITFLEHTVLQ